MAKANDTFVRTADAEITSHTPTGADAGSGWVYSFAGSGVTVSAANDNAYDSNAGSGNRCKMNDDLGYDEMDVQADFTTVASGGESVFFGLLGRLPSASDITGIEFTYDITTGVWNLEDGFNSVQFSEAWPGGVVVMKLQIRREDIRGYANGVQKVQLLTDNRAGRQYAGFMLGNFSGTPGRVTIDNYQSEGIQVVRGAVNPSGFFAGG